MQCTTTDLPASSRLCHPCVFKLLQIPFPFFSHPCKTRGSLWSLCFRPQCPMCCAFRFSFVRRVFSATCRLFFSLCPLFTHVCLCFQRVAASFAKIPGVWVQRGRGRSGGRAVNGRGRMRKRGPSGGGTLRRESPQQGQRPSSQNARVASARSQWPRASHCGLMHCTVKPGRNCISFSLTAATPFAAAARSETRIPQLRTAVGADSVAG
jgi:hypothetical protein